MKTEEFLEIIRLYPGKRLVFEYEPGQFVKPGFHITEVKNHRIEAVDCGGRADSWNETVIQLWEDPQTRAKPEELTGLKTQGILGKVSRLRPMDGSAELRIEYGNTRFHTAQLHVAGHEISKDNLKFALSVHPTECKAQEICGVAPVELESKGCCDPGTNCC